MYYGERFNAVSIEFAYTSCRTPVGRFRTYGMPTLSYIAIGHRAIARTTRYRQPIVVILDSRRNHMRNVQSGQDSKLSDATLASRIQGGNWNTLAVRPAKVLYDEVECQWSIERFIFEQGLPRDDEFD